MGRARPLITAAALSGVGYFCYKKYRQLTPQFTERLAERPANKFGQITAGRALLEFNRTVVNVRPDTYLGESIKSSTGKLPLSLNRQRYREESGPQGIIPFPEKNKTYSTGTTIDDLEQDLQQEYPHQADRLGRAYYAMTGLQSKSQQKHYPQGEVVAIEAQVTSTGPRKQYPEHSLIHCRDCALNVTSVDRNLFGVQKQAICLDDLEKKSPVIATCIVGATEKKTRFQFIEFISYQPNNCVLLVKDQNNRPYILKHISYEKFGGVQNYPTTMAALQCVRQAAFELDHLKNIGEDLGVVPIISETKFGYVDVKGLPYDEIAFFKLAPYVEAQPVAHIKNQLNHSQWHRLTDNMARYLARLHTRGRHIELVYTGKTATNITVARTHNHPHMNNWLVNVNNFDKLYLIDWELSHNYGIANKHPLMMSADLKTVMAGIPKDQRVHFMQCYLEEWQTNVPHMSPQDQTAALTLIEQEISKRL